MKHEEIYHTCDRCGKKIDIMPGEIPLFQKILKRKVDTEEYEEITTDVKAYISNQLKQDVDSMEIVITWHYYTKRKKFDLCGDCRKAFERFMKNYET